MNVLHTKKFRYGSVSVALTAVIIAAVILFNAIFTALSNKFLWYLDMTSEQVYTLSDAAKELMERVERDVTITFCADRDVLEEDELTRYPLYTALELADKFPHVKVRFVDWITNPSAVSKYKEISGQNINNYSVIITSGNSDPNDPREETRVCSVTDMYTANTAGTAYNGYSGEQRFVSDILAVTQLELPVAGIVTNHGEMDNFLVGSGENVSLSARAQLLDLLYDVGYERKEIKLNEEEIPADCRLLVIYGPTSDFIRSELQKLEAFLNNGNAIMVFFDYETPKLPYFEEFLEAWGITVMREGEGNYLIEDQNHSYTPNGYTTVGEYVTDGGLGSTITKSMRENVTHPKDVVFPWATAIGAPDFYTPCKHDDYGYWMYQYDKDGVSRVRYDVFLSYDSAVAKAGGETVEGAKAPYALMTVTQESRVVDNTTKYSYVFACSSLDFTMALESSYGNHAVLTYTCSILGRAYAPISLETKYFTNTEISTITAKAANQYTIVLTVVPASMIFIAGIYVMVRRRYR